MSTITRDSVPLGYQTQARDTCIEADLVEFALLRDRTPQQRQAIAVGLMKRARQLSRDSLKRRFPKLKGTALARKLAEAWLQEDCPQDFLPGEDEMMWIQDPLEIAFWLHDLLESLQVRYFITGGAAAILYGEPRTTRDLDLVVAIQPPQLDAAIAALEESDFYVAGIEDVRSGQRNVLQIVHQATIARADLILARDTPFNRAQLQRRQAIPLEGGRQLYYASPEDVVLSKLQWQRESQSEKQWRDILGILKVQSEAIDGDYLQDWATRLNVRGELQQAFTQAGLTWD